MGFDPNGTLACGPDGNDDMVVALRPARQGDSLLLESSPRRWSLGASASCDFVIDDDRHVSGNHCTIERRSDGTLAVRDRNSKNGTYIDNNRIEAAELRVGSRLRIGKTELVALAMRNSSSPKSAAEILRGHDPAFLRALDQAHRAALSDCSVLILGETGTGKDLVARLIHESSRRARKGKFVPVNCGAMPRELIGSELFGYVKGAFTGAVTDRDGLFAEAHDGTIFLDEIGELPLEQQPHLLRVLEQKRVRKVGGHNETAIDVRVIAATHRMAGLGTESSKLRVDLYHRIATIVIEVPPLRQRMGDVYELVHAMLEELEANHGRKRVIEDGWKALASHAWPGNVRELRHSVERAVAMAKSADLGPNDFFPPGTNRPVFELNNEELQPYDAMLRSAMELALKTHGSIRSAAAYLGMAKSTFADKARAWGLLPMPRAKANPAVIAALKRSGRGTQPLPLPAPPVEDDSDAFDKVVAFAPMTSSDLEPSVPIEPEQILEAEDEFDPNRCYQVSDDDER